MALEKDLAYVTGVDYAYLSPDAQVRTQADGETRRPSQDGSHLIDARQFVLRE